MGPSSRPEQHLNLNYLPQLGPNPGQPRSGSSTAATSPMEPSPGNPLKSPFNNMPPMNAGAAAAARVNAGSPSHEYGGRLYSKRAREIQAQEGLAPQVWGPPTSGNSTPLRETIPESPTGDSFPDFNQGAPAETTSVPSSTRRTRAGTLPSRFSPTTGLNTLNVPSTLVPKTSRPTPSTSPFKPGSHTPTDATGFPPNATTLPPNSALLSRLRAGSMPQQRASLIPPTTNPFGSSLFSSAWASGRDRSSTLASIRSSDGPDSPAQSSFSRDSLAEGDVKTLDYLGLVDTPQQSRATLAPSSIEMLLESQRNANIADLAALTKNANRFRSYSVNAKEKYADEEDDPMGQMGYGSYSGSITPSGEMSAQSYAAIQEAVRQHNLDVQAFANFASVNRPRARTAGVLESPSTRLMRSYVPTASRLDSSMTAGDLSEEAEYNGLAEAVQGLQLAGAAKGEGSGDEHSAESPTRALWLGNIPSSTTVSSLNVIFSNFGTIESTRVLTHKNCGFVNFENLESAIHARSQLNGKEIFPGAGPIRIGYAKVPSASGTPGHNGLFPSPSPDPLAKAAQGEGQVQNTETLLIAAQANGSPLDVTSAVPRTPALIDIKADIVEIVKELGATDDEQMRIAQTVEMAVQYDDYRMEVPPVPEPSHNRLHDAPRLREIRKRIDNNTCTPAEIEDTALGMLPEIAELSSDYLGNTVVQKLFEFCSEEVKEAMLNEIAPHLAEIGVHKNGTWAAQKIIDVARTPTLMAMVVDALRPYSVALFLDQFGNYVMQGCLRYQFPLNNFIFDAMLSKLWELAQGRFGARAMRACLESHYATKDQQRMVAAAIALHSVQLATNANGALLLTWFLDTCTFPRRRSVLAPRLVPHLVHLCTHKVAYLTVLKIINQRNEPEARDAILQALFFSEGDRVLTEILSDQACGATLIFKVLTTPFFDEKIRNDVVSNVRTVLLKIKAQPQQGYKRLMDEVGLSTRIGGVGGVRDASRDAGDSSRPMSKHSNVNGHLPQPQIDTSMSRPYYPVGPSSAGGFDPTTGLQRTGSMDSSSTFDNYPMNVNMNGMNGMNASPMTYTPSPTAGPGMPMQMPNMTPQQMQYQQAMMAQNQQRNFYPPLNVNVNGVNGYGTPSPQMDAYRAMGGSPMAGSPMMSTPQSGFGGPGFSPMMAGQMPGQMPGQIPGQQMWNPQQYGMGGGYMGMQPQAQQAGGMRRGRR